MKQPIIDFFRTYKGVLLFFISMFAADIVWKLCISGDEQSATIFFLKRYDWSEAFAFISTIIAKVTYFFTFIFDSSAILRENIISFPDSKGIMIVWSCSGIKQMFIFLIIVVYPDRTTYMFFNQHITHHHTGTNHKRPSRDIPFYAPLCT